MLQSAHDCPRVHTTAPICCAVSHAPLFVLFFPTCHTPFFVFRCVSSAALLYETEARNQTRSAFVRGGSGGSGGSGGGSGSGSGDSGSGDSGSGDSVSGSGGSGSGSGDSGSGGSGSGGSGSGGSGSGDSGSGDSGGYVESGDAGATLELACETPVKVHLPGGSVFADPRTLGSGLHYKGPSHSGAFAYVTATDGGSRAADAAATRAMSRHWVYTFTYYASGGAATPQLGSRRFFFDPDGWPVLEQELSAQWEGGCAAAQARPYGSKSSSRTHCTHHAARGSHCTGTVLHRTHPGVSSNGAERDALHGQIDVEGSAGWRREQVDQCSVLGQTGSDGGDRGSGDSGSGDSGSGDSGSGDSGYDGDDDDVPWPDIAASDVAGLWALYMSTGGPNWPPDESYGWSETAQHACSNWSGVICDSNDRVLGLDLTWRPMLSGTLPFEIAALRRLEELHISNTSLSGTLPASIALLNASREWVLSHNRLSGTINAPDEGVGDALPYLTRVLTNDNYFSGTIPAGLGELSNLRELLANDNYFSGTLPAGLGELSNLQELRFENNPMSGTVPLSFANLKSLSSCGLGEGMDLYCSEFQSMAGACSGYSCTPPPPASPLGSSGDSGDSDNGSGDRGSGDSDSGDSGSGDSGSGDSGYDGDDDDVPWPDIAASDVAGLWALYMSTGGPNWPPDESYGWSETAQHACSNWSGVICDSNDRVLGLDLTWRPMLSGTLPFEIAALRRLEELHISNTSLSGTLPASIALLNASREWVLSHNRLSGTINAPDEGVGDALPYLTRVLTNDNYFSGTIPAGLGELSNLRELLANDNYFSGTLPAGLGELSNLQELRFENNPMSGTVPLSFANLKSLSSCGLGEGMDLYCSEFQSMAGACSGYSCTPPPPASPLGSSGDSGDNGSGDRGSGDSGSGDSGSGDSGSIDPVGVSAPLPRENLRGNCLGGCRPLACAATPACRADTRTRAAAGTLDACDPAYAARCRSHALLTATPWEPHELEGAAPLYVTRRGTELAQTSQETPTPAHASCHASEHVSRITPSRGPLDGGTSVTVHGTGFGAPARCRFGSVERANLVVSSHEIVCTSPQLDEVYSSGTLSAFLSRPGGVEVLRRQASLSQVSHPFTTHWPHPIFQTPFVTPHLPLPICHTPFATLHSPHPIRYIPCVAPHVSHPILTIHHRLFLLPNLTSSRFASRFL